MIFYKQATNIALALFLTGCVTFPTPESEQVTVIWDEINQLENCDHKDTVYGSEGHFYDFWLHADKDMIWGALNQMRIQAAKKGGNVLYLYKPFSFTSSVTFLGNVYFCDKYYKETYTKAKKKEAKNKT